MTTEQLKKIEHSFKHGDGFVFVFDDKVYVSFSDTKKHKRHKTIEIKSCNEIDESCFTAEGGYYGEVKEGKEYNFIFRDPYAGNENVLAAIYYLEDLVKITVHKSAQ